MYKKSNKPKRVNFNKFENIKKRAIAAAIAGAILGTSLSVYSLISNNRRRNDLYNNTIIEEVINSDDFKLTSDNSTFIKLLESSDYIIDENIKNDFDNRKLDYIYDMYSDIWFLEQSQNKVGYKKDGMEIIYKDIPKFIDALEYLVSTRIAGDINYYSNGEVNAKYNKMGKSILYNAIINDDDLSLIIDAIENKEELFKLNNGDLIVRLKKVISASIRVCSNSYVTIYNNDNNYNSIITTLDNSYVETYNLLEDSLKEYLVKYFDIKSTIDKLSFISETDNEKIRWYLYDSADNKGYFINDTISNDMLNEMGMYRNILSCYYNLNEKDFVPKSRYNDCGIELENKMFKSYKKINSLKK